MIQAVIFDMDGVLVDSEIYHFEAEKLILEKIGISIQEEEIHSFVGLAMDKMWERVKKKYHLKKSVSKLVEEDTIFRVNYFRNVGEIPPIDGVKELIEAIKTEGLKTAVASSSHPDLIKTVLEASNLLQYFPVYLSGFQVKHGKPDPDIFLETAAKLGVKPKNCIVIEDSYNGVTAAKKAGMKCIGYQNPSSGKQDISSADLIIKNFDQLNMDLLKSLCTPKI
ncbi:MAG: HAD family phosphatase [Spirochaetaceae bacterium]|nr:HAD family phosphatase [Spirochaetaceae bacterium]